MIDIIFNVFAIIGIVCVGVMTYFLFRWLWQYPVKRLLKIHKHSYQINHIAQMYNKERGCEKWDICFKCEKCGKYKDSIFWNDRIQLQVKVDDE